MPKPPIPEMFDELLDSAVLAHLATIDGSGEPQVNPVWFLRDGPNILIGVREDTRKYQNLRGNNRLALSISDPQKPHRYVEIRGFVSEFERYTDLSFVNQLAHKYTGKDFPKDTEGDVRYKLTIEVTFWTGQG